MRLRQVVGYVLRVRTNVYIILASSLGYLFLAGIRTFAVIFARGHFGVGQAAATLLLALVGAGSLLGLLTSGRLADGLIRRGRIAARSRSRALVHPRGGSACPGAADTRLALAGPLLIAALWQPCRPQPAAGRGST